MSREERNDERDRRAAERARRLYVAARGTQEEEAPEPAPAALVPEEISFAQPRSRSNSLTHWNEETLSIESSRPRRATISSDDHISIIDQEGTAEVPALEDGSVGTVYRDQHRDWRDRQERHQRPIAHESGIYVRAAPVHVAQNLPGVTRPDPTVGEQEQSNTRPPCQTQVPPMPLPIWNGYMWVLPTPIPPIGQPQAWQNVAQMGANVHRSIQEAPGPHVPYYNNPWIPQYSAGIPPAHVPESARPISASRNVPMNIPIPQFATTGPRNVVSGSRVAGNRRESLGRTTEQEAAPVSSSERRPETRDINGIPEVTQLKSVNPGVFPLRERQLGPHLDRKEARELAALEYKVEKYPYLESLDPAPVNRFLAEFASYERGLQTSIGVRSATLLRYIDFKIQNDLTRMGVNISSRDAVLMTLESLSIQDMETRRIYLVKQVKGELKWKNKGNPPASMRAFCLEADRLRDGLVLNGFTNRNFVRKSRPDYQRSFE